VLGGVLSLLGLKEGGARLLIGPGIVGDDLGFSAQFYHIRKLVHAQLELFACSIQASDSLPNAVFATPSGLAWQP